MTYQKDTQTDKEEFLTVILSNMFKSKTSKSLIF